MTVIESQLAFRSKPQRSNVVPPRIAAEVAHYQRRRSDHLTLPTRWYRDEDVFRFELTSVFPYAWQLAGPLSSVSQPGDQLLADVGQVPIVVTRGRDGLLRALVNICQHRAYPVALENRNSPLLQCQYHGWTYNLDGSLRAAPLCSKEELSGKGVALKPASVDIWNGLVFVNPDPDAESLADAFPELEDLGTEWELAFNDGDYEYRGVTSIEIDANWKAWCENANECYHCPTIHAESFDAEFKSLKDREVRVTQNLVGAINGYRESGPVLARHGMDPTYGERYVYLHPGSFFSKDDYHIFAGYTVPVAVDKTRFVSHTWARKGLDPAFAVDWENMWERTMGEDADAVRLQNAGLRSGMMSYGQLSSPADEMILKFHELVVRSYADVATRG
ncbi:aromatic ring-hydroxylating dioxygenase subunit alpha [Microbacterium sp.]|uniref:aromatic ring-hydroxylating oxygenase subunit alpha n=1 Tax=Microbacterium sp. TaxID=51671 RepID=UPI002732B213|nr:aromatic ring-hydroxylating dioxygenase subunit alpha [Microbacterium sp.]MDP3949835.1 aromatic ring-hydroxylating dioxygenase subunit alpha [Microbacterium sp.]